MMGYNLQIGRLQHKDSQKWNSYTVCSEEGTVNGKSYKMLDVRRRDAPAFEEPTDYTNERWSSYSAWASFCKAYEGLDALMFSSVGLMPTHPGLALITKEHVDQVNKIYDTALKKVQRVNLISTHVDFDFCMLTWLHYWINYAYRWYKYPLFYNS